MHVLWIFPQNTRICFDVHIYRHTYMYMRGWACVCLTKLLGWTEQTKYIFYFYSKNNWQHQFYSHKEQHAWLMECVRLCHRWAESSKLATTLIDYRQKEMTGKNSHQWWMTFYKVWKYKWGKTSSVTFSEHHLSKHRTHGKSAINDLVMLLLPRFPVVFFYIYKHKVSVSTGPNWNACACVDVFYSDVCLCIFMVLQLEGRRYVAFIL